MFTAALLVRLEATAGKDAEVEELLRSSLPMVESEPATTAWFAVRFGRNEYGIFDVFPDDAGRQDHLSGPVAEALMGKADELFSTPPDVRPIGVLASKLPVPAPTTPASVVTKGLLLTIKAKPGKEEDVGRFLRDAQPMVMDEPGTTAWFALDMGDGHFGVFDVFPDNAGRFAHLTGRVPRELAKNALSLLGGFPDMDMVNVLAAKLPR